MYLAFRVAIWPLIPIPEPFVHDEFSYLLASDTFAHGRLANDMHPMGQFFESPHIFVAPHYISMYQPGMGLLLAVGQTVFGQPYYGVVLGCAALCAALAQMVLAWSNRRWALLSGAAACVIFQPGMDWATSYMGGEIAATGAAIGLTALGHLFRRRAPWGLPHFGIAAFLLLLSRPFEGGCFLLAVVGVSLWHSLGRVAVGPIVRTNLPIIALAFCFQLYYNYRGTDSPWVVPYLLHDHLYSVFRIFWFLPLHEVRTYGHPRLYAQHGLNGFEVAVWRSWQGLSPLAIATRLMKNIFSIGVQSWLSRPIGILMLAGAIPAALRSKKSQYLLPIAMAAAFPLCLIAFHTPHYAAPLIVTLFLIAALSLRRLDLLRIGNFAAGRPIVLLVFLVICAQASLSISSLNDTLTDPLTPPRRSALIQKLEALPGNHLVIIHYPQQETWNVFQEWVYNSADPDRSRIVFAHDLGPALLPSLLTYYASRQTWILDFSTDGSYSLNPI